MVLGGDRLLCTERRHDHLLVRRPHRRAPRRHERRPRRRSPACATPCPRSTTSGRPCRPATSRATSCRSPCRRSWCATRLKHVQDEVRTPEMVGPILEIYEAACGAPLTERPYFSVTNCTIAPAAARQGDDRGRPHALQARRADLRAAHAPGGHDRPRDGAQRLHRQHGRAAVGHRALPARQPRLRDHLRASAPASPTCAPAATSRRAPRSA